MLHLQKPKTKIILFETQEVSKTRGKKLQVPAGKGVSLRDLEQTSIGEERNTEEYREISEDDQSEAELQTEEEAETEELAETEIEQSEMDETDSSIDINTFLIVKFVSPKNVDKYYVGNVTEVIDKDQNIYLVNFLRKQTSEKMGTYFTYPQIKDESLIEGSQIFTILKIVTDLRRQRYQFPIPSRMGSIRLE